MRPRALLLEDINPVAAKVFDEADFEVVTFAKSLNAESIAELAQGATVLGIRSGPEIPASILEAGKDTLRAIGCFCVGTNQVAMQEATQQGVAVFNSVQENTRSVAEYVIGSVFSLLRRTAEHNQQLHSGIWTKTDEASYEVRGKAIGIVGWGAIGTQVGVLAETLGMNVNYYDPSPQSPAYGNATRMASLAELLQSSDVITLHIPGGEHTRNFINETTISQMNPGSYLINAARGEIVDYEAVASALASGQLGGIAADVFINEPAKKGQAFDHVLRNNPKAILTPHIAGSTKEAQIDIAVKIAEKLVGHVATGSTVGSVNMPTLSVPDLIAPFRILHVHDNVPGVLSSITAQLAEAGINIEKQIQVARGGFGYVAIDTSEIPSQQMLEAIQNTSHTKALRTIYKRD